MKKYRKKPVVIEAVKFFKNLDEVSEFVGDQLVVSGENIPSVGIKTLEGVMTADPGDFIIKGVKGEFYSCKPDIFEQTYEEVTDEG